MNVKFKEIINKVIGNESINEDYSLNLHYTKIKLNPTLLRRKYEEEQFKKYGLNKEKTSELL